MKTNNLWMSALLGCAFAPSTLSAQATFEFLPHVPGYLETNAVDISNDGQTVLVEGRFSTSGGVATAARWTPSGGMQPAFTFQNGLGAAKALSGDGGTIVAHVSTDGVSNRAIRWSVGSGYQELGHLPPEPGLIFAFSGANGVSDNGTVVTGYSADFWNSRAFIWSPGGGMASIGVLPFSNSGIGTAVSGDGSTIVGNSGHVSDRRAFRWTFGSGMEDIGTLGTGGTFANAVSSNGEVVVGLSVIGQWARAYRWTSGGGMVSLGTLPLMQNSVATDVSPDGNIVVGISSSEQFLWSANTGIVNLRALLISQGLGTHVADWVFINDPKVSVSGGRIWIIATGGELEMGSTRIVRPVRVSIPLSSLSAPGIMYNGRVVFPPDFQGASAGHPISVRVTSLQDSSVGIWTTTSLSSSRRFSITLPPSWPAGDYRVSVKGRSHLQVSRNVTFNASGVFDGPMFFHANGDVDQSGEVDAADIDVAIAAFGGDGSNASDVDGSGEVDAADLDIIIANFGATDQ